MFKFRYGHVLLSFFFFLFVFKIIGKFIGRQNHIYGIVFSTFIARVFFFFFFLCKLVDSCQKFWNNFLMFCIFFSTSRQ